MTWMPPAMEVATTTSREELMQAEVMNSLSMLLNWEGVSM